MKTIQQRIEAALNTNDAATIRRTLRRLGFWTACGRCDGKGHINGFAHVANGVCFACAGSKGRVPQMTKVRVAHLEAMVADGALNVGSGTGAKVSKLGTLFMLDAAAHWRSSRAGRVAMFAA